MKIKTKIYLITFTALAFVLMVAATVLVTARQVNLALEENEVANNIIRGLFELGVQTTDYVLHNSERAKTQWEIKHAAITRLLQDTEFQIQEEEAVLERIRRNHADVRAVFDELAAARHRELAAELTQRFVGQLDIRTQTIVGDATSLARASATRVKELRRRANIVVVSSVATIALFLLGVCWLFDRGVARPIRRLHEGTEIISSGNLGYKVGTPAPDEVGQLARAFDKMTEALAGQMGVLQESEERYRLALDNMLEGCQLIGFDWRFLYVNEAVARHGRQTREALLGHTIMELYPGIENTSVFAVFRRCMDERISQRMENEFTFPDGSRGCFELSIRPVPEGIFIVSIEITERRQAEEEIRALNADLERRVAERTTQLEAANKELESFSYSVSHDLRSPLRAIDGYSQILGEDYTGKLDNEGQRLLGVIRESTQKMGALIDDLLTFSKLGRQPIAAIEIDMNALIQEVLREPQVGGARRPSQITAANLPAARGDRALLKQVWINLLSNAIKFAGKKDEPHIEVSGHNDGADNIYGVKDNGVGFDMRYYNKLFGVFQRLHGADQFPGTGVGLAIVQRVVTRHGGRVWAEGKINEGATFYFALPKGESNV